MTDPQWGAQRPPTFRDDAGPIDDPFAEPPAWPKVVGIISIIWAVLSLGCGGCGVLMMGVTLGGAFDNLSPELGPMPDVMKPGVASLITGAASLGWAGLLLAAGIMTLRRRPVGRPLHLAWAAGAILLTIVGLYMQWEQMQRLQAFVQQNPDNPWVKAQGSGQNVGQYIGLGVGIVLGFAWPLFTLVWFGVVKRRPEDFGPQDLPQPAA